MTLGAHRVIVLYVSTVYCAPFNVLESLIYAFVEPIIDSILPPEQARFRHWRSTVDQMTSLTQDIEDTVGFWLRWRLDPCFSISQQPMLSQDHLQVTAIAIWQTHSAWSRSWLVSTASPLPPSRGAGQQHGEWPPQPWLTQLQSTALLPVATVLIPLHWFCHQRRLGKRDWIPAPYISPQPSHPLGLLISGASSQRSRSVYSTPCHGAWISAPLSAQLSTEWECTASQIETPICACLISPSDNDNNICAALWVDHRWSAQRSENTYKILYFNPWHWHPPPPGMALPK